MLTCVICRFDVELDDVELPMGSDHCVCLGCYQRASASQRPMPKTLRREVVATLAVLTESV
jgi:hypothetical protein